MLNLTIIEVATAVKVGGWKNVLVSAQNPWGRDLIAALDELGIRVVPGDRPGPLTDLFIWVANNRDPKERWPKVIGNLEYWQLEVQPHVP